MVSIGIQGLIGIIIIIHMIILSMTICHQSNDNNLVIHMKIMQITVYRTKTNPELLSFPHTDEVHLQHSFSFMKALNEHGVLYRSQIYPDSSHYLRDVRLHLFKTIESFLIENFALNEFSNHYEAFMKMKSFKTPS